jgi:hypothetical protein
MFWRAVVVSHGVCVSFVAVLAVQIVIFATIWNLTIKSNIITPKHPNNARWMVWDIRYL